MPRLVVNFNEDLTSLSSKITPSRISYEALAEKYSEETVLLSVIYSCFYLTVCMESIYDNIVRQERINTRFSATSIDHKGYGTNEEYITVLNKITVKDEKRYFAALTRNIVSSFILKNIDFGNFCTKFTDSQLNTLSIVRKRIHILCDALSGKEISFIEFKEQVLELAESYCNVLNESGLFKRIYRKATHKPDLENTCSVTTNPFTFSLYKEIKQSPENIEMSLLNEYKDQATATVELLYGRPKKLWTENDLLTKIAQLKNELNSYKEYRDESIRINNKCNKIEEEIKVLFAALDSLED